MKVTIKNINKEVYTLEIDSDKTVLDLKNLIFEQHKQNPTWQTLIYSGKILEDKNSLESYKITEQGYIVMMIKKPRETPAATQPTTSSTSSESTTSSNTTTTATSPSTTTTSAPTTTTPTTPNPTPTTSSTPGTSTTTPSTNTTSPSQNTTSTSSSTDFVTGPELENTIKNIVDMGFSREQVIRALRLGYNNADRAVELLIGGQIPENATADDEEEDNMDAGNGEQPSGENPFESLRNHPYFPMLRQAIAHDPNIIQSLLQQLAQTNPELVRQISERPNDFIRIFQEGNGGGNGSGNQPGQFTIQVTREENEAIERLQNLTGLDKQVVIEAYFACDKNEELTASYLFDRQDDD